MQFHIFYDNTPLEIHLQYDLYLFVLWMSENEVEMVSDLSLLWHLHILPHAMILRLKAIYSIQLFLTSLQCKSHILLFIWLQK
jgi:hypothetical protein